MGVLSLDVSMAVDVKTRWKWIALHTSHLQRIINSITSKFTVAIELDMMLGCSQRTCRWHVETPWNARKTPHSTQTQDTDMQLKICDMRRLYVRNYSSNEIFIVSGKGSRGRGFCACNSTALHRRSRRQISTASTQRPHLMLPL